MLRYKIFLIFLGLLAVVLVAVSFKVAGTPLSQKDINLDISRLSDFQDIFYSMEDFYRKNYSLPSNLTELSNIKLQRLTDPETKSQYEYKTLSSSQYQLCAVFSTDNTKEKDTRYYSGSVDTTHKKGYDCITYTISKNLLDNVKPSQTPIYLSPTTILISPTGL